MTVRILAGDCRDRLAELPAGSARMACTSPPYFGLRAYLPDGHPDKAAEIGLEQSPEDYVAALVAVMREVRRVLADDGTLWLNIADSYASTSKGSGGTGRSGLQNDGRREEVRVAGGDRANGRAKFDVRKFDLGACGIKPKDLLMVPARVALALQQDGWWLRSHIVWSKLNPMPESCTDRPTSAHESVFLLAKRERYFYDADAIREPLADARAYPSWDQRKAEGAGSGSRETGRWKPERAGAGVGANPDGRNCRNVWELPSQPWPGSHCATMPPRLAERCILAGSARGDTVIDPFLGAGTTALAADRLGRHCVGVEINPAYADEARRRIEGDAGMFASVAAE